jgi:hypothetical protein
VCVTGSERPQTFFSSGDASLPQEVADGKISVQSACALNTAYLRFVIWNLRSVFDKAMAECDELKSSHLSNSETHVKYHTS